MGWIGWEYVDFAKYYNCAVSLACEKYEVEACGKNRTACYDAEPSWCSGSVLSPSTICYLIEIYTNYACKMLERK